MTFYRKTLLKLGIGHHEFDKNIWLNEPYKRKCFVKNIIQNKIPLGMTRQEVSETFGTYRTEYSEGVWAYVTAKLKNGETKDTLNFYFDKDGRVNNIRTKYRKKAY